MTFLGFIAKILVKKFGRNGDLRVSLPSNKSGVFHSDFLSTTIKSVGQTVRYSPAVFLSLSENTVSVLLFTTCVLRAVRYSPAVFFIPFGKHRLHGRKIVPARGMPEVEKLFKNTLILFYFSLSGKAGQSCAENEHPYRAETWQLCPDIHTDLFRRPTMILVVVLNFRSVRPYFSLPESMPRSPGAYRSAGRDASVAPFVGCASRLTTPTSSHSCRHPLRFSSVPVSSVGQMRFVV